MRLDAELQQAWQKDRSRSLERRRWIARLCALGLVDSAAMAMKQMGVVKHLPDLPLESFDSDGVVGSRAAYALGLPDAPLGALSYALTLALAGIADTATHRRSPWWGVLLGAVVAGGALGAIGYGLDMAFVEKKACAYCIPALLLSLGIVPFAVPEVAGAIRRLL